jgi:hypothetical protein
VQIDDDIVSFTPKAPGEPEIVGDSAQAGSARRNDDFVQMRILSNHRKRLRFDQIRQMRAWKRALQRPEERRRKDHVADQAKTNQKNFQCLKVLWSLRQST